MDGQYQGNYQNYTNDQYSPFQEPQKSGPNGLQVAGLVCGILGIPGCCCYGIVGLLFGVIGLILALVGNKRNRGAGVGIAAVICSIIAIVLGILATLYYGLIIMGLFGSGPFSELIDQLDINEYMYY